MKKPSVNVKQQDRKSEVPGSPVLPIEKGFWETGTVGEIISALRKIVGKTVPSTTQHSEFVRMPESVSYALKYREGEFGQSEVHSMMRPEFKGAGLYLIFKLVDGRPDLQEELLRLLTENIVGGKDYQTIYEELIDIIELKKLDGRVEVKKIGKFFTQGFDLFEDRFSEMAEEIYQQKGVPVLLSYAAFLGLKTFLEKLPVSQSLILFNAEKLDKGDLECGFIIKRNNSSFEISKLNTTFSLADNFAGQPMVMVDDTKSTGKSLEKAKVLFEKQLNWPKIDAEKLAVTLDKK